LKKLKRWLKYFGIVFLTLAVLSFFWNWWVGYSVRDRIFEEIDDIPHQHVAMLLGTAKYARGGQENLFYKYRIEAISKLYTGEKVYYILVSGDNSTMYYNEPQTMKNDLIAAGIPDSNVVEDYAGFRTLDSMVRSKAVFGQDQILVVSQRFHVERALFLGKARGIEAIGFCAQDVPMGYGIKTNIREHFARIKMFVDLYILNKQPKFLGEPVHIPES
jgi:SanA protein